MTLDAAFTPDELSEPDVQNLLHVYLFLLKRARQRKLEMAETEAEPPTIPETAGDSEASARAITSDNRHESYDGP